MGTFDRQIATALRMIDKYGQAVTWRKLTDGGGTPAKPTDGAPVNFPVKIVFLPLNREYKPTFLSMMHDSDVPTGMLLGLMGQVPFDPELVDFVIRGSEQLGMADENGIEKVDPNGEGAILYKLRMVR